MTVQDSSEATHPTSVNNDYSICHRVPSSRRSEGLAGKQCQADDDILPLGSHSTLLHFWFMPPLRTLGWKYPQKKKLVVMTRASGPAT